MGRYDLERQMIDGVRRSVGIKKRKIYGATNKLVRKWADDGGGSGMLIQDHSRPLYGEATQRESLNKIIHGSRKSMVEDLKEYAALHEDDFFRRGYECIKAAKWEGSPD